MDVPVIVITSMTDLDNKVEAIEMGVDDYIVKPVDNAELVARIRATLRRVKAHEKLKSDLERLFQSAVTDSLTQMNNRQFLEADIVNRIASARRHTNRFFSLIITDVDLFKNVNDTFGHVAGDKVLIRFAQILKEASRDCDVVARYGGEEFCIVLPETTVEGAMELAERIRQKVADAVIDDLQGQHITSSFGVAQWVPEDQAFIDLLRRADQALYRAKQGGRNRVEGTL
jgi:two-component system cell cycle response regulator